MRKDLITHTIFTIAFLLLVSFIRGWLDPIYWLLWLGAVVGIVLPDIDYLIYIYYLKPQAGVSQSATSLIEGKSWLRSWDLMAKTRSEHSDLIFHNASFQLIFLLVTLWVVTSSGSLFGIGLVLAFSLHLLIDQVSDYMEKGTIKNWLAKFRISFTSKDEKLYLIANVIILAVLGFFI